MKTSGELRVSTAEEPKTTNAIRCLLRISSGMPVIRSIRAGPLMSRKHPIFPTSRNTSLAALTVLKRHYNRSPWHRQSTRPGLLPRCEAPVIFSRVAVSWASKSDSTIGQPHRSGLCVTGCDRCGPAVSFASDLSFGSSSTGALIVLYNGSFH